MYCRLALGVFLWFRNSDPQFYHICTFFTTSRFISALRFSADTIFTLQLSRCEYRQQGIAADSGARVILLIICQSMKYPLWTNTGVWLLCTIYWEYLESPCANGASPVTCSKKCPSQLPAISLDLPQPTTIGLYLITPRNVLLERIDRFLFAPMEQ